MQLIVNYTNEIFHDIRFYINTYMPLDVQYNYYNKERCTGVKCRMQSLIEKPNHDSAVYYSITVIMTQLFITALLTQTYNITN